MRRSRLRELPPDEGKAHEEDLRRLESLDDDSLLSNQSSTISLDESSICSSDYRTEETSIPAESPCLHTNTQLTALATTESSGSSSSASPWEDETDSSSSGISSASPVASQYSTDSESRFDEARSRMIAQRSKTVLQAKSVASSGECSGKNPDRPIDCVSKEKQISLLSFSNQLKDRTIGTKSQSKTPAARPVPNVELSVTETIGKQEARTAFDRSLPQVVPICHVLDEDDVSTIGVPLPPHRSVFYHHRHPINKYLYQDPERGMKIQKIVSNRKTTKEDATEGWLAQRTDLERFFICLIVTALVTLVILCSLILVKG